MNPKWPVPLRTIAFPAALFLFIPAPNWAAARPPAEPAGILAQATPSATPYFIQDSGVDGPTLLLIGGVHGNEPAGAYAAEQIRHWPIQRGKLVIVPRANVTALAAHTRHTPGAEASEGNLNRNFPKAGEQGSARGLLAGELWALAQQFKPDWLIDLHEGFDFNRINPASVGSTIIVHPAPPANAAAARMLEAVNATITDDQKKFHTRGPPINGSLARAAAEQLGARAMILETTTKSQPLSQRARQHRLMVHALLTHLGVLDGSVQVDQITDPRRAATHTMVALYDAGGSAGQGVPRVEQHLAEMKDTVIVRVGPEEIQNGALNQFDLVIFTGGSASRQANAIGETGRAQVKSFIEEGGGYIGICAGAYLATSGFSWGLKILNAQTISSQWRRGRGLVKMELTEAGRDVLGGHEGHFDVLYVNGPVVMPAEFEGLEEYQTLGYFRTELAQNGTPEGIMIDSPSILAGTCGKGRVISISPHPEQTAGLEEFIRRAVQWVAAPNRVAARETESTGAE